MLEVSGKSVRNRIFILVGSLLVVVAAGAAVFFFVQYRKLSEDPAVQQQATTQRIKKEVGEIYQLPLDEEATVAQIQDKEKLKDQVFFKNAQNGDYILIFTKAKLALLYRDTDHKLVNVGPITISDTSQTKSDTETGQ